MAKFRKKPVVIEAFQLGIGLDLWPQWAKDTLGHKVDGTVYSRHAGGIEIVLHPQHADIRTREGVMRADLGDWIIRGVKGELYPCKPDIFEATYEAV